MSRNLFGSKIDEQKGIKIIVWGAWYGSKNVGDQALLISISDLLGGKINNIEFIVLTDNPEHVNKYTKRDSLYRFTPLHARRQFNKVVQAFAEADLFILGGGVPFYDDTAHSIAIVILATLSQFFRVPCVLWAVSSQKVDSLISKLALRYLLFGTSVVTCRDRHTYNLLLECGAKVSGVQLVADSAFTLVSAQAGHALKLLERAGWNAAQPRPLIALTPRLLRGGDGEAHTHYSPKTARDGDKAIDIFAGVLDWLWENGYQPIFVPMNTVSPDDDRRAAHQIMEKAKFGRNAINITEEIFPRDAANIYAQCHAGFVARVHGSVTAFLGGCPVMMYAFDLKHTGIMEQMGFSEYIFDPEKGDLMDSVSMMGRLIELRAKIIAEMGAKHTELTEAAIVPLDAILTLLNPK